jgi:hypothetical protein
VSRHGVHKNPYVGWNPPAELSEWARAEAGERGEALSTILTEALTEYRAKHRAPWSVLALASLEDSADAAAASQARDSIHAGEPVVAWEDVKAEAGLAADTVPPVKLQEPKTAAKKKCEHRGPAGAYCRTCGTTRG